MLCARLTHLARVVRRCQQGGECQLGGPLAATQPIAKFFSKADFRAQAAPSLREIHELRWGAKPPASVDGFSGGKR